MSMGKFKEIHSQSILKHFKDSLSNSLKNTVYLLNCNSSEYYILKLRAFAKLLRKKI